MTRFLKHPGFMIPLCLVIIAAAVIGFMAQPALTTGIPFIQTLPATNVTATSATLNGYIPLISNNTFNKYVFAEGFDTCLFQWGTVQGGPYPHNTPEQLLVSSNFSAFLNGLQVFTTYYYVARVELGAGGQLPGRDMVFANGPISLIGAEVSFTTLGNAGGLNSLLTGDSSPTGGTQPNIIINGNGGSQVTQVNQPVTVYARVINSGDMEGGFTVNLKVNGYVEQTKMGVVPGHEAVPVEFIVIKDVPGTYDIDIEGITTTLTVLAAEEQSNSKLIEPQYVFMAGIGLGIVLIAIAAILMVRRRST